MNPSSKVVDKGLVNKILSQMVKHFIPVGDLFLLDIGQIIVLEPYRAIYFAIPKVANSSIKHFIADLLGIEGLSERRGGKAYIFNKLETRLKLRKDGIIITRAESMRRNDCWKFAFVRNPWSRLVSFYYSAILSPLIMNSLTSSFGNMFWHEMPFEDFVISVCQIPDLVSNQHFMSQHRFIVDSKGKLIPNFIGRFETLNSDFDYVCRKLGNGKQVLRNVNPGKYQGSYRDFYMPSLRNAVHARYETDIKLFNYTF